MSEFIAKPAALVGRLVVDESKYLFAVSDKIQSLESEIKWMQYFLEDEDGIVQQDKLVEMWVAEIKDLTYKAEDIVERYLHDVSYPRQTGKWNTVKWFSCCIGDALVLHDVGSNIDCLRGRISELIPRMQMYGVQIHRRKKTRSIEAINDKRSPLGLEKQTKEIVDRLLEVDYHHNVVAITGEEGIGKTTLALEVYSSSAIKEHFKNNCVWVDITPECDRGYVFGEILFAFTNMDLNWRWRAAKLVTDEEKCEMMSEVLAEKKCFVVLDHIDEEATRNIVEPLFQFIKDTDSKLLFTSREQGFVMHVMTHVCSYPMELLNEDDRWKLLLQETSLQEQLTAADMTADMEYLGKKIACMSGGLPIQIVNLGYALREYDRALPLLRGMGLETERAMRISKIEDMLNFWYGNFPSYMKRLLNYLGSFPGDLEISTERLYHLWEAEGFIPLSEVSMVGDKGSSVDRIAESYLIKLVERGIVKPVENWRYGRMKTCRLHPIVTNFFRRKCKKENFLRVIERQTSEPSSDSFRSSSLATGKMNRCVVHLSDGVMHSSAFDAYENRGTPWIRSLRVFPDKSHKEVEWLLTSTMGKRFSLLRVLDLEGTSIRSRSKVIGNFIHLRYLSLRGASVDGLPPGIWDCVHIETLDLRCLESLELSNKFYKFEKLRHLYLPHSMKLIGSQKLTLSPTQLQKMETLKNFDLEQCQMTDLLEMEIMRIFSFNKRNNLHNEDAMNLLCRSPMITKEHLGYLRLNIETKEVCTIPEILGSIKSCVFKLTVKGKVVEALDSWAVGRVLERSKKVVLQDCEIGEESISELGKLQELERLQLCGSKVLRGNKMRFSSGGFPKLRQLHLSGLTELEEWEVEEGALPRLKHLKILNCNKLQKIPETLPTSVQITRNEIET